MRSIDAPAWRIALFTTTSTRPQLGEDAPRASTTSPTSSRSMRIDRAACGARLDLGRGRLEAAGDGDDRLLAGPVGLRAAFALALRAGGDGDVEARLGELEGRCLADAPAGAGDQCDGGGGHGGRTYDRDRAPGDSGEAAAAAVDLGLDATAPATMSA